MFAKITYNDDPRKDSGSLLATYHLMSVIRRTVPTQIYGAPSITFQLHHLLRVVCVHIIVEVTLRICTPFVLFWRNVKSHLMCLVSNAEEPSFIVEKASVGILRIILKGMYVEDMCTEMIALALDLISLPESILTSSFYPLCAKASSVLYSMIKFLSC